MSRLDQIQFEGSTFCNADCIFCPISTMTRPKGTMSDELFHRIIREGKEMGVNTFIPFLNGEPFANPKIFAWLDYMEKEQVNTYLYTNAELLNKTKIDRLAKYTNIGLIHCSLNAATEKTHQTVMRGPNFKKVVKNIDYLIGKCPFKVTVGMVCVRENYPEKRALWDMYRRRTKYIHFANWGGQIHNSSERTGGKIPCSKILRQMTILWDGKVALCCLDYDGKVILGDLNKQSLKEIWANARSLRSKHRNRDFDMPLCKDCNANSGHLVSANNI